MKFGNLLLLGFSIMSVSCAGLSPKDAKLLEASGQLIPNTGAYADTTFVSLLKRDFNFSEKSADGAKYAVELTAYTLCLPRGVRISMPSSFAELADFEKAFSGYILDKSQNSETLALGESKITNFKNARTHFLLEGGIHKPCPKGMGVAFGASLDKASDEVLSLKIYASYVPMVNLALFAPKVMVEDFPKNALALTKAEFVGLAPSFFVIRHKADDFAPEDFSAPQSYLNANYNGGATLLRTVIFAQLKKI